MRIKLTHLFTASLISLSVVFSAISNADAGKPQIGGTIKSDGDWTLFGTDMYSEVTGNVGIGDTAPDGKLEVNPDEIEDNGDEFVINSIGRVGIGTTSPAVNLDIRSTVGTTSLQLSAESAVADSTIRLGTDGAVNFTMGVDDSDADKFKIGTGTNFGPDSTTKLTLTGAGNVGIGTTEPNAKLDIKAGNTSDVLLHLAKYGNDSKQLVIGNTNQPSSEWFFRVDNTSHFSLNKDNVSTPYIFIDTNSSNVGIGTTTPDHKLDVNGTIGSNGTTYHSDIRWKKNISTITDALDKVTDLRGVNFEWKVDDFPEKEFSEGTNLGFIAQEVEEVLPELVTTGTDGFKSVQYANIVSVLVEAIKELKAELDEVKKAVQ